MHSLYDPARESHRLLESVAGSGCLVFLGLGGGFHVAAALEDPNVAAVLVIEKDMPTLRALLDRVPLAPVLADARVRVLAGHEGIRPGLFSAWQPALMGSLQTVALRSWCEAQKSFFDTAVSELRLAIDAVRADYGVQAHFGKRWFSNMLMNLEAAERPSAELPAGATAHVTAAGPSLELQMAEIAAPVRRGLLIASDTSLPALLRWGATPDAVISLDCQNHSYHHFLQGVPARTTLFLDLASPPFLPRRATRVAFIASGHPFASYICSRWKQFPAVDTSGGNVAQAAVSLARYLGARTITLHGADFCYPGGKPYSRGTYLYDFFDSTQSRVAPTESRIWAFLNRSSDVRRERIGERSIYTTTLLREYHGRMARLIETIDAQVIPAPGDGLPLPDGSSRRPGGDAHALVPPAPSAPRCGWREFLSDYAKELSGIDSSGHPVGALYHALDARQRELWETILPIAAQVIAEGGDGMIGAPSIVEARRWALARISRILTPQGPAPYA